MARKRTTESDTETSDAPELQHFTCAQRGCEFEAMEAPENCPTCGHPFVQKDGDGNETGE